MTKAEEIRRAAARKLKDLPPRRGDNFRFVSCQDITEMKLWVRP